jgi:hypothetical protein
MRKLPYEKLDDEDFAIMQSVLEKRNAKYKRNELYAKNAHSIIKEMSYEKPIKSDGTKQ